MSDRIKSVKLGRFYWILQNSLAISLFAKSAQMIVGLSQKNLLGVKYKLVVVYNFSDKSH